MGFFQYKSVEKGWIKVIEIVSYTVLAALCWLGGWRFTLRLFKKKEVELPKKKKIVIEIVSGVLLEALAVTLALLLVQAGIISYFEALRAELVMCALLFAGLIDFRLMIIPNKLTLALLVTTVLSYVIEFIINSNYITRIALDALLGCAVCFVIFFVGKLISRKGMGMGDIKLAAVMGLALGLNSSLGCLLWAMIIASLTGIILLLTKKMKTKSKLAMAPFFFAGTVVGHIMLAVGGRL